MKKTLQISVFILLSLSLLAPSSASVESFANRMGTIAGQSESGNEQVAIEVVSLNRGDVLYRHNENALLNPASCTKIITTAAALKLLGPNYRFHTKFYTDQPPRNGKVGTLWVKGYGDPSIVIERLWRIARDISNTGLREIKGDIIIDDGYFDGYTYPGYSDTSGRAYNSMAGALSLNYNTVTIVVSPTSRVGAPPHVAPDTAGPYFRISNRAKTGPRGSQNTITVSRTKKDNEDVLTIRGRIPVESPPQYIYRNISNPALYFGLAFKSLLEQNDVRVDGQVIHGHSAGRGHLLLDSKSKPLSVILRDMNKYSNNFIAEQLVKTMGAEIESVPGTTSKGIRVIQNYLEHLGIPPRSYTLVNGSGLTRKNKISPATLIAVLANIYTDHKISPEAMASFSVAGVDGTARERYRAKEVHGIARTKTGTLSGVSTLAGIIPSTSGETLGYAILMNGNGIGWGQSHKLQERMLQAMAAFMR